MHMLLQPVSTGAGTLANEHLALLRHLARLQRQMTLLVASHRQQLAHWQSQLMRQSVRLMVERTRVDWGLVSAAVAAEKWQASCSAQQETEALICRTGCVMDDHHWREGEFCRRSGKACEHSEAEDWLRR